MMTGNELIQQIKLALDKYSASSSAIIGPAFLDSEIMAFANLAMVQVISTKFTGNNELGLGFDDSVKRISDLEHTIVSQAYTLHYSELGGEYTTNLLTTKYDAFYKPTGDNTLTESEAYDLLFVVRAKLTLKKVYTTTSTDEYGQTIIERRLRTAYEVEAKPTTHSNILKFVVTPTNKPYVPNPMYISSQRYNEKLSENGLRLTARGFNVCVDPELLTKYQLTINDEQDSSAIGKYVYQFTVTYVIKPDELSETNLGSTAFGGAFKDTVLYEIINKAALLMLDNIESERVENKASLNKTQE